MSSCSRLYLPIFRPLDQTGKVIPYGYVYFYGAGTSTPATVYADKDGITPINQPVRLDVNGEAVIYLDDSVTYKVNVLDGNAVQLPNWPQDYVKGLDNSTSILADTTTATKGAGAVSFIAALNYAANTVGGWMKRLIQHFAGAAYPADPLQGQVAYRTDKGRLDYFDGSWKSIWQQHGQCRFDYVNANTCRLTPFNGNKLIIGSVIETIPSAGVDLAVTGLTPSTLYYVYAYMNGASMTLEASTTGHSKDATTGVEIKTGDSSRTLVGAISPIAGPIFVDSQSQRHVASWFNQKLKSGSAGFSSARSFSNTSIAEVHVESRISYWSWGAVTVHLQASLSNNGGTSYLGIGVDTTAAWTSWVAISVANVLIPASSSICTPTSEGLHTNYVLGQVTANTGTVASGSSQSVSVMG